MHNTDDTNHNSAAATAPKGPRALDHPGARSDSPPNQSLEFELQAMRESGTFRYTLTLDRVDPADVEMEEKKSWTARLGESVTSGELRGLLVLGRNRSLGYRPGFSLIEVDETAWGGRPGKMVSAVAEAPATWRLGPVAAIRALQSPLAVEDDGILHVSGSLVRVLRVTLDTAVATVALGGPAHRIIFESGGQVTSLELEPAEVNPAEVDWDRLPEEPLW